MKSLVKKYLNRTPTINEKSLTEREEKIGDRQFPSGTKLKYIEIDNKIDNNLNTSMDEIDKLALNKEKFKYKIRVNDLRRIRWDLFVMILSVWNCYTLPFDVAFKPPVFETVYLTVFNNIIDFVFFLDIILNFRTTIYNR